MKKKKLIKKIKSIKKKNIDFNKLPKSKQVIAIAKDVIAQIKVNKYNVETGSYLRDVIFKNDLNLYINSDLDIKSNFNKIESCTCCALGACLLSATKFKNILTFDDIRPTHFLNSENNDNLFKELFTPYQLLLIESAFEGYNMDDKRYANLNFGFNILKVSDIDKVESFYYRYINSSERLIEIMKNIIKNKGIFKP